MNDLQNKLFLLQDCEYRDFQSALLPTVPKERVIGVRAPDLRKLSKRVDAKDAYLENLPHFFYEENNLHAYFLNEIKDFDLCVQKVSVFLPYVDNWATCDSLRPKVFGKQAEKLLPYINEWIKSSHPYTVRFGIEMLMCHFLDERFELCYAEQVASVSMEHYYVKMMMAWYFATALAKKYTEILPFLTNGRLEPWVHQKTIQKAIESYRITSEQKKELKELKDCRK